MEKGYHLKPRKIEMVDLVGSSVEHGITGESSLKNEFFPKVRPVQLSVSNCDSKYKQILNCETVFYLIRLNPRHNLFKTIRN